MGREITSLEGKQDIYIVMWWIFKYLTIDLIAAVIIVSIAIYFAFKVKKKKYKVMGLTDYLPGVFRKNRKKKKEISEGEKMSRSIFEDIFKVPFKTIRPNWLKNPITNRNLELDGYNADIKTPIGKGLAFEYDGEQHAKYNKRFHGNNPQNFVYQCKRDTWKDQRCKELGILLIRIPHYVVPVNLRSYILNALAKSGIKK